MSDNRSVATDALATLGTIIDDTAKRDAIHLAVIPMVAGHILDPGTHCAVEDGVAHQADHDDVETVGIVDPFLTKPVRKGQRFWLVILPRTIQSLRHVWSHPAFPDEPVAGAASPPEAPPVDARSASEEWLRNWCDSHDVPGYETIMENIVCGEEFIHTGSIDYSDSLTSEFWDHVEVVTGKKQKRELYFSCAC